MGPHRLLRRHLPLKGEDCENSDALVFQGEPGRRVWAPTACYAGTSP